MNACFSLAAEKRKSKHKRSVRFAESNDTKHLDDETEDRAKSVQQKLRQLAGHDVVSYPVKTSML